MRKGRIAAGVAAVLLASAMGSGSAHADADSEDVFGGESADDGFEVSVSHLSVHIDDTPMTTSAATENAVADVYLAADVTCVLRQAANEEGELLNEDTDLCEDEEGLSTAELVALVSSEFRVLPLAAPQITYQPEGDWALVNMDFIVYTGAEQQLLETTLLGVPITVRATPVHYSWDFDDGSAPLVTTDPGQPYPNQTVAHVYTSTSDAVEVTLTTSWQGEFQINGGGTWLPIAGFATTTSSAAPVEIVAMDVHLVP